MWSLEHKAYEHLRTQVHTYLKSTNHLSIQAKSSKRLSVRTSNYMITQASKPIHILASKCLTCVCISYKWISMFVIMRLSKHLNIGVYNHQIVQTYEHEIIQANGHVIIKTFRHGSIWSSKKHVNIGASNHRSVRVYKH